MSTSTTTTSTTTTTTSTAQPAVDPYQSFKSKLQDIYQKATMVRDCGECINTNMIPVMVGGNLQRVDGPSIGFAITDIKTKQKTCYQDCRADLTKLLADLDALYASLPA